LSAFKASFSFIQEKSKRHILCLVNTLAYTNNKVCYFNMFTMWE